MSDKERDGGRMVAHIVATGTLLVKAEEID